MMERKTKENILQGTESNMKDRASTRQEER